MAVNINVAVGSMKRKDIASYLEWWGFDPKLAGRVQALALRSKLLAFSKDGIASTDGALFVVKGT